MYVPKKPKLEDIRDREQKRRSSQVHILPLTGKQRSTDDQGQETYKSF